MNIKNNIIHFLATLAVASIFAWGCEDDAYYIDYEKLEDEGAALFDRFMALDSVARDTLYAKIRGDYPMLDTIDDRNEGGPLMYITHRSGETDSIMSGHYVGVRFIYWGIFENEDGNIDVDTMYLDRYYDEPTTFMIDNYSSTYYVSNGINRGVKFMKPFERAIMVLPSTLLYSYGTAQSIFASTSFGLADQYRPIIADVEVTYWTDR
ncbi:MAG: hypothetical protein LBV41_02880 [Cytophagaceae bacterium]|jgi:hypothetical protein|nr:hypothetical protein [Cytophagaceae bacterium]